MASEQLKEQLVKHIDEAYAMEQNVLRMLDGMVKTTEDSEIKEELRHHKLETERHAERMKERLEAHSATPSMVKEAGGIAGALMKSTLRVLESTEEKRTRAVCDGYATRAPGDRELPAPRADRAAGRRRGDRRGRAGEPQGRRGDGKKARHTLGQVRGAVDERRGRHGLSRAGLIPRGLSQEPLVGQSPFRGQSLP
jgi:hypothetical protein